MNKRQKLLAKLNAGESVVTDYIPPMQNRYVTVPHGGKAFEATIDQREGVAQLRSCGWEIKDISKAMRIPLRTLERHFKDELADGKAFVHGMVARGIARGALSGDKTLMIFYAKAQMGWVDTKPWGMPVDKNGNAQSLFTVNIMGLGQPQTTITGPVIEATPDNTK